MPRGASLNEATDRIAEPEYGSAGPDSTVSSRRSALGEPPFEDIDSLDPRLFQKPPRGKRRDPNLKLPASICLDAAGRVILTPGLVERLYYHHGHTLQDLENFSGWCMAFITGAMEAWGMQRRRPLQLGSPSQVTSVGQPRRNYFAAAPDGTEVRFNSSEELQTFEATVNSFMADYDDWKAPEKQQLKNLAILSVGIHRLSEEARSHASASKQAEIMQKIAGLIKTTYDVQKQMGMSRGQRDQAEQQETPATWYERIMQDFLRQEQMGA